MLRRIQTSPPRGTKADVPPLRMNRPRRPCWPTSFLWGSPSNPFVFVLMPMPPTSYSVLSAATKPQVANLSSISSHLHRNQSASDPSGDEYFFLAAVVCMYSGFAERTLFRAISCNNSV